MSNIKKIRKKESKNQDKIQYPPLLKMDQPINIRYPPFQTRACQKNRQMTYKSLTILKFNKRCLHRNFYLTKNLTGPNIALFVTNVLQNLTTTAHG